MTQEEFLLKWNDHHASFFTIVEDLCRTEQLCDVTLACGGQVFETHKLILSVCSPYFRTLLNSRPDKHPIVYLKDVNPKHLEQLLSYMYRGEINVLQEDLGPLIETARGLQIKGLADAGESNNSRKDPPRRTTPNGLPGSTPTSLGTPKRARTTTPTPAPKVARKESRPTPPAVTVPHIQISNSNSSFEGSEEPVEVDPSDTDSNIKQEMWMMGTNEGEEEDEEEGEFVIPPEQYEQDMQAEDEQYIQAGTEGLSGQQALGAGLALPAGVSLTSLATLSSSYNSGRSTSSREELEEGVSPPPSFAPTLQCPSCPRQFSVPSLLERHMRSHSQDRPHQCKICGRSYTQSGNLNVHMKTVHGVLEPAGARVGGGVHLESSRPHKCYICNRLFTTTSNMYQHIRVVHNMPDASPSSSPRTQLEPWAQRSLQELRSLTTEQTLPPSSSVSSIILSSPSSSSSSSANKRREATIEDTLAQLSALAGGKSEKGKGKAPSLHTMDQDKPILATPIKEEKQ